MDTDSDPISDLTTSTIDLDFPVVPARATDTLGEQEQFDYQQRRERFAKWLLREGKDPTDKEGYAQRTTENTISRTSIFDRWVWNHEDTYVPLPTTDHANKFIEQIAYSDRSQSDKHNHLHSLKRYFNWRHHAHNHDKWNPDQSFNVSNSQKPQDELTRTERRQLRETVLDYETIPAYRTVKNNPERREPLYEYVADYLGKDSPDDVYVQEWKDATIPSWRYTTLVWVSLDAGLRPEEVANATTAWVDTDNALLRIPKDESTKNRENWKVSLRANTADALDNWLYERAHYPKYDDTDRLWLTGKGNPFRSKSLRRLLHRLCDEAGIDYEDRRMSWYSIRHSVGTYMTHEVSLAATQEQLRHKDAETTMRYITPDTDVRRDALDRME